MKTLVSIRFVLSKYYCFLLFAFITSCIPQNKLKYLQDPVIEQNIYTLATPPRNLVKPNDELFIRVSTFDDIAYNFFGNQSESGRAANSSELSVNLISYTVDEAGTIYFPVIGRVLVENLTLDEVRLKLEDLLKAYFNQPSAIVKYAYKKVSIIGEVNNPGNYTYTKEKLNVLEALSIAGDLTMHGDRRNIYLIRSENQTIKKIKINLTDDTFLSSNNYFICPDDIIYVNPRNSIKWSTIATPVSMILSGVSTVILVINFIQN